MVTLETKISQLKTLIEATLLPIINHDYVLWDCPYYANIGDILIWEGEKAFLKNVNYNCLNFASFATCSFPDLAKETIILLGGGGNFGDLWEYNQKFRLQVIKRYPYNRIIIFPQTVYYKDKKVMEKDSLMMSEHNALTICARDTASYEILKTYFRNDILLLPDMAFCISLNILESLKIPVTDKILYLKRSDKELATDESIIPDADVRDWPSLEKKSLILFFLEKGLSVNRYFKNYGFHFLSKVCCHLLDLYADRIFRPLLIKTGVRFLSQYRYIYTTRLHAMILSILLGKGCHFVDNSYGKNYLFYKTWLEDLPGVKQMES